MSSGTSCRPPEPDQVLEDVEWNQQIIEGFSVPVPTRSKRLEGSFSHEYVFHGKYAGWAVGSVPVSRMAVIVEKHRMLTGWDVEALPEADIVCQLSTLESTYGTSLSRDILICRDGEPILGLEMMTSLGHKGLNEKLKSRLIEDQHIFEYVLANIRKVEKGQLVKPTIQLAGEGIRRERKWSPNVIIQQLPQTIKLPDWAMDEAPAKDDPK